MKIKILCVGKIKEKYFTDAIEEYTKRLGRFCKTEIVEVAECTAYKTDLSASEIDKIKKSEGKDLLARIEGFGICLDIGGKQLASEELASKIDEIKNTNSVITFVIGGSFGMDDSVKNACKLKISFGKCTYPHQLMRVILCEQVYRAFMINSGSAYHK
ncbi:MAG: 23S rRNA (pseudouridine(1915)-N(3))-methyltransferase RlmH [Clostridia bacterium]|nr:23S rRNA (pseudouridine(1915)-N(3))-methyltransferase RlmH [Clostridia bacterium]